MPRQLLAGSQLTSLYWPKNNRANLLPNIWLRGMTGAYDPRGDYEHRLKAPGPGDTQDDSDTFLWAPYDKSADQVRGAL